MKYTKGFVAAIFGRKCHFAFRQKEALGHVVSTAGVSPDPDKIKAVTYFPVPQTIEDLRTFLGLCSYFRRFVRSFASITPPLTALLRKGSVFHLSSNCSRAFSQVKAVLTSSPVLRHYNPDAPVVIHTDASRD